MGEIIEEKNRVCKGTLYLVSTPIGNLSDLSERAKKVLCEVDFIAAEDTRNTARLLSAFGIRQSMVSYHDHNRRERGPVIADRLAAGESCALVTDAGTPAVSDPGEDLVALCAERGIPVTAIPGCCAFLAALSLSGLPTARFCFEGFLPKDKKDRRERLSQLSTERRTLIFHEAPHRLRETLSEFEAVFGSGRRIALCRELTKRNEEIERTVLSDAVAAYTAREPRGEYVLVLEGASEQAATVETAADSRMPVSPAAHVALYEERGLPRMEAIKAAARDRGLPKNEFYRLLEQEKKQLPAE